MGKEYSLTRPEPKPSQIAYEKELNPEQLRVVTAGEGPTLVLAGPGSGKTRTLTYRVAYLIERGFDPKNILLVTFTVKAAKEMMERVERLLKYKPEGLRGGTFHHIGNLILRQHADKLGWTSSFGILDEEDAKDLVSTCMADMKLPAAKTRLPQADVLESIFSLSTNTYRPIEEIVSTQYSQFSDLVPLIEKIRDAYTERKKKANVMDYDDLLYQLLALLRDYPEGRRYAEGFHYVLVDEYQDTNKLQFELVKQFAAARRNILAVGDDAQSIYAFRGAEVKNLLDFPNTFPGTTIYKLETNYRSTPEILRLANASIQFNTKQFPKELRSVKEHGEQPALVPLMEGKQQAAFVAQRVLELREEGLPLREMAVLFRARFQSAELELELAKRNIPYLVRGGVRFFEQAHIKDVLAHLKILANPNDEMAWQRVLQLQEGIGNTYARKIWEAISTGGASPLSEAIRGKGNDAVPARAQSSLKRLCGLLQGLSSPAVSNHPVEQILAVLQGGYEEHLKTHFKDAQNRKDDLEQLINLASNYQSSAKFVEDLTLREPFKGETILGWQEPDEFLVLSTIHQAKGLEWGAVFLIGLAEGQFPHAKSVEDTDALEEERRLFYVAVTRCKSHLYLTYPLTRYTYQRGEVLMRPSTFLQELPENLCELWRVSDDSPSYL